MSDLALRLPKPQIGTLTTVSKAQQRKSLKAKPVQGSPSEAQKKTTVPPLVVTPSLKKSKDQFAKQPNNKTRSSQLPTEAL